MASTMQTKRVSTINGMILTPDDGFVLGNGDLSVSVYQKPGQIVWRFGKGDVWDRRDATDENPPAVTMDELRNGIEVEGWRCPAYGGKIEATKGSKDIRRAQEAVSSPPSQKFPYPMPKPVGELSLNYPGDMQDIEITQNLCIDDATLEITCTWRNDECLKIFCFIPPTTNVLVVKWRLENFHPGMPQPFFKTIPIWLSLYRWTDPDIEESAVKWKTTYGCPMLEGFVNPKAAPLPKPEILEFEDKLLIRQRFYKDLLFPDGFEYILGCATSLPSIQKVDTKKQYEARLTLSPEPPMTFEDVKEFMTVDQQLRDGTIGYPELQTYDGWAAVAINTSSDGAEPEQKLLTTLNELKTNPEATLDRWQQECKDAAGEFWSRSSIQLGEKTLENLWYEILHVCRCVYREDSVPPGLFLSSTIHDHTLWRGDYHTNYNIQQPFWGFLTANHPEFLGSYFTIMDFLDQIGKKISHDYCGTRGTFIQIAGFPIQSKDDHFPTGPMGRMPYMTGWAPEIHWFYYLYTKDKDFLRDRAYPFIKDCALFYTDFLQLDEDDKYHAFPSCWGEEGYDGTKEKNTDALQTIEYAESIMRIASAAAEILGVDSELRDEWQKRIDNLAEGLGENEWRPLPEASQPDQKLLNTPAFRPGENYRFPNKFRFKDRWWGWVDKMPISLIRDIRGGQFNVDEDFSELIEIIERWRHPNGLVWPMPIRYYGRPGIWTEGFGLIAPIQEMLLQSWNGKITVFPAWPKSIDAQFENFRGQGAFLVSAELKQEKIYEFTIKSLKGSDCIVCNPWLGMEVEIINENDKLILKQTADEIEFPTSVGSTYKLKPVRLTAKDVQDIYLRRFCQANYEYYGQIINHVCKEEKHEQSISCSPQERGNYSKGSCPTGRCQPDNDL